MTKENGLKILLNEEIHIISENDIEAKKESNWKNGNFIVCIILTIINIYIVLFVMWVNIIFKNFVIKHGWEFWWILLIWYMPIMIISLYIFKLISNNCFKLNLFIISIPYLNWLLFVASCIADPWMMR